MMLEYPKFDTTDCRIHATYDRIMARREAEPGTENLPLYEPSSSTRRVFEDEPQTSHYRLVATLTLVFVAMIVWRFVL